MSKLSGPLMKVAVPLAKNISAPLGITATASTFDAGIQKKRNGSGRTTLTLFKMGFFGAAHGWGGERSPFLKSVTHILHR